MRDGHHFICPQCSNLLTRDWVEAWCVGHEGSFSAAPPEKPDERWTRMCELPESVMDVLTDEARTAKLA